MANQHGADGQGPPPSKKVADAVAPFFEDDNPPPRDPKVQAQIEQAIAKREPVWRKLKKK